MRRKVVLLILCMILVGYLSGCATLQKAQKADELEKELTALKDKYEQLKVEKDIEIAHLLSEKKNEVERVAEEKDKKLSELEKAKIDLEQRLGKELADFKAKLEMTERGLVITFLSEVFFESGKDTIKSDGEEILEKVAEVLNKDVIDSCVAIEGHSDNEPIKYSGWKSNWELSSARALAVLHYLVDECQVKPQRLSANGYGEFRPIASNDTFEGRQKNRRVEIVILPADVKKVR